MNFGLLIVGEKGRYVLGELINNCDLPEFVVSYNDKNVLDEAYVEISNMCQEYNIKFLSTKDDVMYSLFDSVDKVFVIGWQFLLKEKLDKMVIIHDSYLPEYKGWSPTVNYLIEGSHYLAATAFEPTMKVDTGDVYCQRKIYIDYPIKISDAIQMVSTLYIHLIYTVLRGAEKKPMVGKESFCMWRNKNDYNINWNWDAKKIKRFVDAVGYPFDGANIKYYDGKWTNFITVKDAVVCPDIKLINRESHIGKFWSLDDGKPTIICGKGLIKLTSMERASSEYKFKRLKIRL